MQKVFNSDIVYKSNLLEGYILNPNNVSDDDVRPFVNEGYYNKFIVDRQNKDDFFTDRESAILFGIPSNFIEGILVGRKYEKDKKMLNKINEIFSNNELLSKIFKYYETLDETYLHKDLKSKEGTIYIGTLSYTKGLRSYTTAGATSLKIPLYKKILSFLGFITSTSYLQIKDVMEVNTLLVPKDTDIYLQAEFIRYENKETGEIKKLRLISNKEAKTISLARLYLLSLKNLSKSTILKNYKAIWLMQVTPTKNKPLNDKIIELPVHDLSFDFIEELLKKVEYSTMNRDSKLSLCDYLLNQNFESFSNMICTFSKNNTIMMDKYF